VQIKKNNLKTPSCHDCRQNVAANQVPLGRLMELRGKSFLIRHRASDSSFILNYRKYSDSVSLKFQLETPGFGTVL